MYEILLPRPRWLYHRLKLRLRPPEIIKPDQVQKILTEYGLELTATPQIPAVIGRSRSLIVDTHLGKKVFKRYEMFVEPSTVVHEHSILTYLAQINFPVPRLAVTRTGETFVYKEGLTFAVFDFIEGYRQYHNYILLPAQARRFVTAAGETLATLHEQLQGFVPEGQHPDGFKSLTGNRWRDSKWFTDKLSHCRIETPRLNPAEEEASAVITVLLQRAGWMQETLHRLDNVLRVEAPSRLTIHGDYGPYNLLYKRNASLIVLDFELARLDWRITDVAKAILFFAYHRRLGFSFGKMERFLEAYRARYPIHDDELLLVPTVLQFWLIRRIIAHWHHYCRTRAGHWLAPTQEALECVNWITDNRDRLLAHLVTTRKPS